MLWSKLKEMYDNLKLVHLPQAHYDWIHLKLQDFKSTSDWLSAIHASMDTFEATRF